MMQHRSQTPDLPLHNGHNYSNHTNENTNEKASAPPPKPPAPQTKQGQDEEKARRQASKDLSESWMNRLQLISVITTFFASTEAGMLQVTSTGQDENAGNQVANSVFLAALVLHVWAAILSFMGAFFLVRYDLKEAKKEENQAGVNSNSSSDSQPATDPRLCANPYLEQVGPFNRKPPTHLLSRCHNLCILLAFVGFALAILGIVVYAWVQNPISVGVVTSVSTAGCFVAALWVFVR
ncbi:hypothetical protein C8R45DRAFT_134878 [Mycena sanguinolenta]|nr:hypothetical protein C8R45DRAFT_134878 [Mycena sanguinolenta]